jgi:lipopolysaccharide export system protein LptA
MQLEAAHAELNRSTQRATLRQVRFEGQRTGGPEKMSAEEAIVLLTEAGTPRHVDASGGVTLQPASGRTVRSAKMAVDLNAAGQPQNLYASGGVRYAGDEPLRKGTASAQDARVWFDAQGRARRMVATGKVEMLQRAHPAAAAPWTTRSLSGDQVDATFVPAGTGKQVALSEIQATGVARLVAEDPAAAKAGAQAGSTTTTLTANRIDTRLLGTADGLAHLHGEGRAELLQATSDGARQDDRGDAMDVVFRSAPARGAKRPAQTAAPGNIVSASLQGHVEMTETAARRSVDAKAPATGHGSASRADYDAAQNRILLSGSAQWTSAGRTVWADRISTDRTSGDAEAQGGVKASIVKEGAPATAEATHVAADHARIRRAAQTAEFFGSGSVPVRMWQGSSQVEAPILVLEQAQQRLTARGNGPGMQVHSVFAGTPSTSRAEGTARVQVVRIASHELVYSDGPRQGVFRGGVQVQSADGSVTADRAEVWLQPADATQPAGVKAAASTGVFGGSVDHMVASGRVRLTQPGRRGTGEQLVYTAAGQRFVLTGTPAEPPMLTDRRGTTTGASLIFHAGDDSVEILGGPAGDASREVHTETRVKPRTRQP